MPRFLAVAMLTVCWAIAVSASEQSVPDTGSHRDEVFHPALDAICGRGARMSEGCAAIRARRIVDAADPPWRAIGRVNFASIEIRQHCTGTLVGDRMVLTAAHCLYNVPRKSWIPPTSLRFAAGYQRGQPVAQARVLRYLLDPAQDSASRDFRGGMTRDWALLELEAPIGRDVGFLPLAEPEAGEPARLAGYAGLRPHVLSVAEDCGAWTPLAQRGIALTACSAMPGDSGAPLLVERDGALLVAGVFSTIVVTEGGIPHSLAVAAPVFAPALRAVLAN
ncbi:trypsin-like serine peptidase [Antarcticimicrobium luteum]|nr:trypsin-like serine protease [Antarcticimicrobium luteum]